MIKNIDLKKNIIIENFSSYENLYFLIGNLRSIEYLFDYHNKFKKLNNSDLVISTWKENNHDTYFYEKIKNKIKPLYFEIENFNFNLTTDIFGNLNKFDLMFGKSALSTRAQIYKFIKMIEITKNLEVSQNKKYNLLFKSRPDLFFNSKINLNVSDNILYFENTIGNWSKDRSDRFFYGRKKIFLEYINSLKFFANKSWDNERMYPIIEKIPILEQFMKHCVDKHNFNSKPVIHVLKVWRPLKKPSFKNKLMIIFYILKRIIRNLINN